MIRVIDFKRDNYGVPGTVAAIEYDPNRTARIALVHYRDGDKRYILAPQGLQVGDVVKVLGTDLTGATSVSFNGAAATFTVVSRYLITTTVPGGARSGKSGW